MTTTSSYRIKQRIDLKRMQSTSTSVKYMRMMKYTHKSYPNYRTISERARLTVKKKEKKEKRKNKESILRLTDSLYFVS